MFSSNDTLLQADRAGIGDTTTLLTIASLVLRSGSEILRLPKNGRLSGFESHATR
jgi:hypothetical protein